MSEELIWEKIKNQEERIRKLEKYFLKEQPFNCECIECGFKMVSEKHCVDIVCPKCGGQMRRAERPGPGR